tara:strand:- start:5436 stop:7202 length:1767 start_codon:yes stop_codon:yes gene_type:complete
MRIKVDIPEYSDRYGEDENSDLNEFIHTLLWALMCQGCTITSSDNEEDYDVRLVTCLSSQKTLEKKLKKPTVGIINKIKKPNNLLKEIASWQVENLDQWQIIKNSDCVIFFTKFLKDTFSSILPNDVTQDLEGKFKIIEPSTDLDVLETCTSFSMGNNHQHSTLVEKNGDDHSLVLILCEDELVGLKSTRFFLSVVPDNFRTIVLCPDKFDPQFFKQLFGGEKNLTKESRDRVSHLAHKRLHQFYGLIGNAKYIIYLSDGLDTKNGLFFSKLLGVPVLTNDAGSNASSVCENSMIFMNNFDTSKLIHESFDEFDLKKNKFFTKINNPGHQKNSKDIHALATQYIQIFKEICKTKKENSTVIEKTHSEQFFDFLKVLDDNKVRYVLMRGFGKFPEEADTDVDLLYHLDDHNKYIELAKEHLTPYDAGRGSEWTSMGSGEWCEMMYSPCRTRGEDDPKISNGCFRVDAYNSLHFKTPYNNFTTFWTVDKEYNDFVLEARKRVDAPYGSYFIPEAESEISLLVARNVLDNKKRPMWNKKHKKRVEELLPVVNLQTLSDRIERLFPNSEKIVEMLKSKKYESVMGYALGRKS